MLGLIAIDGCAVANDLRYSPVALVNPNMEAKSSPMSKFASIR